MRPRDLLRGPGLFSDGTLWRAAAALFGNKERIQLQSLDWRRPRDMAFQRGGAPEANNRLHGTGPKGSNKGPMRQHQSRLSTPSTHNSGVSFE